MLYGKEEMMGNSIMSLVILGWFSARDIKLKRLAMGELLVAAVLAGGMTLICKNELKSMFAGVTVGLVIYVIACGSREQIGKGDAFLLMITGSLLGGRGNVELLLLALLLASCYAGWLLLVCRVGRKKQIPFVPFLGGAQLLRLILQLVGNSS